MLKKESLLKMAEVRERWCVSMFMPINQIEPQKNRIRLKNLWFDAEKKLLQLEMDPHQVKRMLAPLEMILEKLDFWKNQKNGFAAFFTKDSFVWYSVPVHMKELVVVTDRLHLKPLMRNLTHNENFYLLTLSQNQIKFFEATESGINEIILRGMPRNISVATEGDGKQLQMHSSGNGTPIFHGHGGVEENKKGKILEIFRKVNKVVSDFLKTEETPLVLAGVEYLHPIYREANSYQHLIEDSILGNVESLSPTQLFEKALPIVKPVLRRDREIAIEMFEEKLGTGLASQNLIEIFKAALNGRIDTLFVPIGKQQWGNYDREKNELKIHENAKPGDKDLFCVVSTKTLMTGGKVFAVLPEQMPNNTQIAAVMRY